MINWLSDWILSLLIIFPLVGMLGLLFLPQTFTRITAVFIVAIEFLLSLYLVYRFEPYTSGFQFEQILSWLPDSTGVKYIVGIDGLNLMLVLLTTSMFLLVVVSTWSSVLTKVKPFLCLLLLLESSIIGTFVSLDLVLFYVFWELVLIPMYFIIGIWGGKRRVYAAIKFFLYTAFGSLIMLVAFCYIYYKHSSHGFGVPSARISDLYVTISHLPLQEQMWLFIACTLAFAIKIPLFPLHTWLPDAHVEAPTAGSVILASVLLKMGTYGLMRFCLPMFPLAAKQAAPIMMGLGTIGIIYGALIAWQQTDIKKLVAYSSVSHMGFIVAGIFSLNEIGLTGALFQTINHGITTGALFLCVGVLYERQHTKQIDAFGGLAKVIPKYSFLLFVIALGSMAVPGSGGFIGEWLILLGVFNTNKIFALFMSVGVILSAVYILHLIYKLLWGEPANNQLYDKLHDLSARESFVIGTLVVATFLTGIFSASILDHAQLSILNLKKSISSPKADTPQTDLGVYND